MVGWVHIRVQLKWGLAASTLNVAASEAQLGQVGRARVTSRVVIEVRVLPQGPDLNLTQANPNPDLCHVQVLRAGHPGPRRSHARGAAGADHDGDADHGVVLRREGRQRHGRAGRHLPAADHHLGQGAGHRHVMRGCAGGATRALRLWAANTRMLSCPFTTSHARAMESAEVCPSCVPLDQG